MKILRARIVLPVSSPPIENGGVGVEGDRIVAVGRLEDLPAGEVEDVGEVILMPGLINAHCHLDYTVMRGAILQQKNFPQWVRRINELKRTLTDDDYLTSIGDGFAELRRWGTTSVFNIESFPELMVRLPPPLIRTWWFYEMMDIRNRLHTEDVVAGALTFFEKRPDWLGGFGLSPHAPYTASAGLYELAKFCCEQHGMPWTTHLAETEEEFLMFVAGAGPLHEFLHSLGRNMDDTGGITPVARLLRDGNVPRGGILAHMNWLADSDYGLLAERSRDLSVVHCPKCHAYFGRPPFQIERLRQTGLSLCLGTDSLASNSSLNLFSEMRELRAGHPSLAHADILDMVTRNPARAIGLGGTLGEFTPGALADLIALPYGGGIDDVFEAVIGNETAVDWMMVNGRRVG